MTARRVRPADRKPDPSAPSVPRRSRARTPEEVAQVATERDVSVGPSGDKVKVSLTLTLGRAQVEHLTARAIRQGKNLEAFVAEILESVPPSRATKREEKRR